MPHAPALDHRRPARLRGIVGLFLSLSFVTPALAEIAPPAGSFTLTICTGFGMETVRLGPDGKPLPVQPTSQGGCAHLWCGCGTRRARTPGRI